MTIIPKSILTMGRDELRAPVDPFSDAGTHFMVPNVKEYVLARLGPRLRLIRRGKRAVLVWIGGGGVLNSLERRLMRQILAGGNPREWWD